MISLYFSVDFLFISGSKQKRRVQEFEPFQNALLPDSIDYLQSSRQKTTQGEFLETHHAASTISSMSNRMLAPPRASVGHVTMRAIRRVPRGKAPKTI